MKLEHYNVEILYSLFFCFSESIKSLFWHSGGVDESGDYCEDPSKLINNMLLDDIINNDILSTLSKKILI